MESNGVMDGVVKRINRGTEDGRVRAIWRGLFPVFIAQFLQLIGIATLFVVLDLGMNVQPSTGMALVTLVVMGVLVLVSTGAALIVSSHLDHQPYANYGFEWSLKWLRDLVGGIAIGIIMTSAVAVYLQTRGYATITVDISGGSGTSHPLLLLIISLSLIFYLLMNNIYEEVVFRGIMLRNFAEGLTARSVSLLPAVGGALVSSLSIFGVFHLLPPGGGGIHAATTSAGLGLVFALAYVFTGELSLPIGIHFGGVFLYSMIQESILGLNLPTIIYLSFSTIPTYEVLLVRMIVGIALVLGWVYLLYGNMSLNEFPHSGDKRES